MKVGILSIIKNEHDYLDEWIQYHLDLGVDKIYIFEDVGSESHSDICSKYDKVVLSSVLSLYDESYRDELTRIKINHIDRFGCQVKFFKDALDYIKANDDLDWVSYIDTDEFITLADDDDNLHDVVSYYKDYSLVILQWQNYNANGHIHKPAGSMIDNYTTKCILYAGRRMDARASCKLLFNMKYWDRHTVRCNMHIPSNNYNWCKTDFSQRLEDAVYDKIYIRHYITKSLEEFCNKIFVRGQFCGSKNMSVFFAMNKEIDRHSDAVKDIVNNYYDKFMSGELKFIPVINNVVK